MRRALAEQLLSDPELEADGRLLLEAFNAGLFCIDPGAITAQLTANFGLAGQLYGESFLRELTGRELGWIEKNMPLPEFRRELAAKLEARIMRLVRSGLLNKDGTVARPALELSALVLACQELGGYAVRDLAGRQAMRKSCLFGSREEHVDFRKGMGWRALALKRSVKTALRRGHRELQLEDLRAFRRASHQARAIIYAVDCSGSMRGQKIAAAKRAGLALARHAIEQRDRVGLVLFADRVRASSPPTCEFLELAGVLAPARAAAETNIEAALGAAAALLEREKGARHIILLTDVLPTAGLEPERAMLDKIAELAAVGITTSIVGISLDAKGAALGRRAAELGRGRLFCARELSQLGAIVLEDYNALD